MNIGLFQFNQTVTLVSDEQFRGYYQALLAKEDPALGQMALISIAKPGATGRRGMVAFPLSELRPVKAVVR